MEDGKAILTETFLITKQISASSDRPKQFGKGMQQDEELQTSGQLVGNSIAVQGLTLNLAG